MPVASGIAEIDVICTPAVGIKSANGHEMPGIHDYAECKPAEEQKEHTPFRHLAGSWQLFRLDKNTVHYSMPYADIREEQQHRHEKRERRLRRHHAQQSHHGGNPPVTSNG